MILKIIGVGLVCVILSILLKQYKPEFALLVSIMGALVIFGMMTEGLKEIVSQMFVLSNISGLNSDILVPVIKVIGVGYLTEFTSNVAEDSGNKLIANYVLLGGKIAICIIALPIVKNLINTIFSVILWKKQHFFLFY
mgnify:CR=1 FL=1